MGGQKPSTAEDREQLAKRWKDLVEKFDAELRAKGLSDEERERLLQDLLKGDGE